jgi:hypothetical protein
MRIILHVYGGLVWGGANKPRAGGCGGQDAALCRASGGGSQSTSSHQERMESAAIDAALAAHADAHSSRDKLVLALGQSADLINATASIWTMLPGPVPEIKWRWDPSIIAIIASATTEIACRREWAEKHVGITAETLTPVFGPKPPPPNKCRLFGMCVCKGRGKIINKIHRRLEQHLKARFPHRSSDRDLWADGHMAFELTVTEPIRSKEDVPFEDRPIASRMWFHLSLQYFKPYRSTVMAMAPCNRVPSRSGGVVLQPDLRAATHAHDFWPCCTCHEGLSLNDLRGAWMVRLMQAWDSLQVVGRSFDPGAIEFIYLDNGDAVVWNGTLPEKPQRRRKKLPAVEAPLAPEALLDAGPPADNHDDDSPDHAGDASSERTDDSGDDSEASNESDKSDTPPDVGELLRLLEELEDTDRALGTDGPGAAPAAPPPPGDGAPASSDVCASTVDSGDYQSIDSEDLARLSSDDSGVSCGSDPPSEADASDDDRGPPGDRGARGSGSRDLGPRGPRSKQDGLSVFTFGEGSRIFSESSIKYNASADNFYASCPNRKHGRCIATRSAHAGHRKAQGRPLGYLAAWVLAAFNTGLDTKENHKGYEPSRTVRRKARRALCQPCNSELLDDFRGRERQDNYSDEFETEPEDCP